MEKYIYIYCILRGAVNNHWADKPPPPSPPKKNPSRFSMNVNQAMNCINFAGVLHDALAFHNAMHIITGKRFFFSIC